MTPPYRQPETLLQDDQDLFGREGELYFAPSDLLAAANAALVIQRPLLLTGEAGCGKTDFAFAAASGLAPEGADAKATKPLECYVRSDSRARDLLYHYDAVERFGDVQHGDKKRAKDARPYLKLEALGRALVSPVRRVVLIDEIDKAPRDLPNDLLRELDQSAFEIPEIATDAGDSAVPIDPDDPMTFRRTMERPDADVKPFVIITSNVERQLPDPFLRRCVFFHIPFPERHDLEKIVRSRFDDEPFIKRVIDVFEAARKVPSTTKKPSTSEMIHWAEALSALYGTGAVRQRLDDLVGGADRKTVSYSEIRWRDLPAMGCLVKLREDRDRLLEVGIQ